MALISITRGPNNWDLTLSTFDPKPAGMHGVRWIYFTMANGDNLRGELVGLAWEPYPADGRRLLTINTHGGTPRGYAGTVPNSSGSMDVKVEWDAIHRSGIVDLDLISPCHYVSLVPDTFSFGTLEVERCSECKEIVTRRSFTTGEWEWLDGRPITTSAKLRSVIGTTDGIELERLSKI